MKITTSRLFDTKAVIAALTAAKVSGLDDFVENLGDLSEQVVRILRRRVSLGDNIDCLVQSYSMVHDVALTVQNPDPKRLVQHILATRTLSFANPVTALAWSYTAQGDIQLKAQLLGAPSSAVMVSMVMYY